MRILLLDTETNGLPASRYAPVSMGQAWPHLLQLSWAIYRTGTSESGSGSRNLHTEKCRDLNITLPPDIPWNTGAAAIHGMAEEDARAGTPVRSALLELAADLCAVDVIVAHNLAFDKPVLQAAAYRVGLRGDVFWPGSGSGSDSSVQEFCTMVATRGMLKLPYPEPKPGAPVFARSNPYKPPKMNELYTWLYGHVYDLSGGSFTALHSARTDTHCLSQCLARLLRRGHLRVQAGTGGSGRETLVGGGVSVPL